MWGNRLLFDTDVLLDALVAARPESGVACRCWSSATEEAMSVRLFAGLVVVIPSGPRNAICRYGTTNRISRGRARPDLCRAERYRFHAYEHSVAFARSKVRSLACARYLEVVAGEKWACSLCVPCFSTRRRLSGASVPKNRL